VQFVALRWNPTATSPSSSARKRCSSWMPRRWTITARGFATSPDKGIRRMRRASRWPSVATISTWTSSPAGSTFMKTPFRFNRPSSVETANPTRSTISIRWETGKRTVSVALGTLRSGRVWGLVPGIL